MAELADARDLKSREIYFSYRFDPGFRHHISRSGAVWQLVGLITRRSWGSNPTSATRKENTPLWCVFSFLATRVARDLSLTICALWARPFGIRANNLQPKGKRLIIVFSTVDTAEQEVGRAECTEAIGDAYANGAVGRDATCTTEYCAARSTKLSSKTSGTPTANLHPV